MVLHCDIQILQISEFQDVLFLPSTVHFALGAIIAVVVMMITTMMVCSWQYL